MVNASLLPQRYPTLPPLSDNATIADAKTTLSNWETRCSETRLVNEENFKAAMRHHTWCVLRSSFLSLFVLIPEAVNVPMHLKSCAIPTWEAHWKETIGEPEDSRG